MGVKRFQRDGYVLCIDQATKKQWREQDNGPGLLRKAGNFAKAATNHVTTGRVPATLEVIQDRFETCKDCPSNLFVWLEPERLPNSLKVAGEVGTCKHKSCGCFIHGALTFPNKLAWQSSKCPLGHWSE